MGGQDKRTGDPHDWVGKALPAGQRTFRDWLLWLWLTGGGLGAVPVAPGTFGTLGGVVLALLLQWSLLGSATGEGGALVMAGVWLAAAALLTLASWPMTGPIRRLFGREDPGAVVIDEVIGYLVTVAIASLGTDGPPGPWVHAVGFALFRTFDILKRPWTWRLQGIPGAAGVLLDDIAAGVWAGAVMLAALPFLPA